MNNRHQRRGLCWLFLLAAFVQHSLNPSSVRAEAGELDDRVYWQAHRGGGTTDAPDNTMAAFVHTWGLGGIPEADIHTTSDGVIICIHDQTLARTTTAPADVRKRNVKTLTFEEIRKWDAGEKFKPEFKGERVPSLEEVFRAMQEDSERQVYLDIKAIDLTKLGELIDVFGVNHQVIIASPQQSDCQALKKITRGIRTMIWIGGSAGDIKRKFDSVARSEFAGLDQVQLHLHETKNNEAFRYHLGSEFLVQALQTSRKAGVDLEVFPRQFDDSSLHVLLDIGIRWFATDEPSRFANSVARWRKKTLAPIVDFPELPANGLPESSEVVLDVGGFETDTVGEPPADWRVFRLTTKPSVRIVKGGLGSGQCVRGQRSASGGLTALERKLKTPQQRVRIDFSFAFSPGNGRSLNIWTHERCGKDASQLNLCIQGGALMQFDGRTRTWEEITRNIQPTLDPAKPVWHRLRAIVDAKASAIDYWVSDPGSGQLPVQPITRAVYRTTSDIAAIDLVSGKRIAPGAWYMLDDLVVVGGKHLPAPHEVEPLPPAVTLWTGPPIPDDVSDIPFVPGVRHQTIHRATADGYKFLHGAAIIHHNGVMYANWANSPTNENGPHETLQGRRSTDGGATWSDLEVIGPGFEGEDRHSHGVLFVHDEELWTICSRFGVGKSGSRFRGLGGEAFVLDEQTNRWNSRGVVMDNCWPYDEPVRMGNGNLITGGQDRDGLPVVAISHGDDLSKWDSVLIPYDPQLKPSYAETTVWAEDDHVIAVIRGGLGVAWVATSDDFGRTWSKARPSQMPMPRAKAYLGKLSTGQMYLLSNLQNRDTLVVSVSKPGEPTLSRMWRIRHGKSEAPRFPGKAKSRQWSYPYGYEHDGKLFVVYSIGKEDCGLSVLPIDSLIP